MAVSTYLWLGLVTKHMTVFGGADLEHDECCSRDQIRLLSCDFTMVKVKSSNCIHDVFHDHGVCFLLPNEKAQERTFFNDFE
jgi:hypothetical protein